MNKQVTLSDSQIDIVCSAIQREQDNLKEQITELTQQLSDLNYKFEENHKTLLSLRSESTRHADVKQSNMNGYPKGASWWEKIRYVFIHEERALTGAEIVDQILSFEPELANVPKEAFDKAKVNIYTTLTHKAKNKILKREKRTNDKEYKYAMAI